MPLLGLTPPLPSYPVPNIPNPNHIDEIDQIYQDPKFYEKVKEIESVTNHDIKAVEYYVKEYLKSKDSLKELVEFVHFTCTSEDINNISHALMLKESKDKCMLPELTTLTNQFDKMIDDVKNPKNLNFSIVALQCSEEPMDNLLRLLQWGRR